MALERGEGEGATHHMILDSLVSYIQKMIHTWFLFIFSIQTFFSSVIIQFQGCLSLSI